MDSNLSDIGIYAGLLALFCIFLVSCKVYVHLQDAFTTTDVYITHSLRTGYSKASTSEVQLGNGVHVHADRRALVAPRGFAGSLAQTVLTCHKGVPFKYTVNSCLLVTSPVTVKKKTGCVARSQPGCTKLT